MSYSVPLAALRADRCVFVGDPSPATGRPYAIVVALTESDEPRAYRNECMHIAIPLGLFPESVLDAGTLLCGTHGARYRIDDGYCFEGPCLGQSLEPLPLVIDGDLVRIRG